jgi:hypothetical protein
MEQEHQEIERRTNGSNFTEGFDPLRIERLRTIIQDYEDQGKAKRYCIIVDGEMVVPVNSEASNFDNYKRYIIGNSNTVEIRMYFGKSPNFNRHIFKTNYSALAGTPSKDVDQIVKDALEKERKDNKILMLEQELKRKNKKLKQYKALQATLDEKKLDLKDLVKDGIQLMGQFQAMKNGATPVQGIQEAEVEVKVESESPIDLHFNQLKKDYEGEELEKAIKIWEIFTAYPQLQKEFMSIINQKIKKNG